MSLAAALAAQLAKSTPEHDVDNNQGHDASRASLGSQLTNRSAL
jgi:hypothetical protein